MTCSNSSQPLRKSAKPSSAASISTRPACAPSSEAVVALSASPNGFTASDIAARVQERRPLYGPATSPTISKSYAARTSFVASVTLAATNRSPAASERSPRWWFSATRSSNLSSPPPGPSTQLAASSSPNPSTPTTRPCGSPCRASFMNWVSLLDHSTRFLLGFAPKCLRRFFRPVPLAGCGKSQQHSPDMGYN